MSIYRLRKFATAGQLASQAAREFLALVQRGSGSVPCIALSGGRIAGLFLSVVATWARRQEVGLGDVHFFWGDERCVPPDDPESNFGLARDRLLLPLGIPEARIHRIRGELSPAEAAEQAGEELRRTAPVGRAGQPALDLVLLGMGEDGHVASLFPGEPEQVMASSAVFRPVMAPKPPPRRVTIGYPALAAAQHVWVLASGPGKRKALEMSLSGGGSTSLGRVLDTCPQVQIFTDLLLRRRPPCSRSR